MKKCLVCGEKARRIKYANCVIDYACSPLHKKLVDVYGYFDKGRFWLGAKGKKLLEKA